MGIATVYGGGKSLAYYGNTSTQTNTMAGNRTYWEWNPDDRPGMWPTAWMQSIGVGQPQTARTMRDSATPIYYSEWIFYSWDLAYLTAQYGPPVSPTTTVTIPILGAITTGSRFGDGPWLSGSAQPHDLLACIPPTVQAPSDLEARNVTDTILGPDNQGEFYAAAPTITEWQMLNTATSGGTPRFPGRPFPSTIGPGGWTQVGTYHSDANIQLGDPAAGTLVVTVDLTQHARDNHLVIVCGTLGQFTQDDALVAEVQTYYGPTTPSTRYDSNEIWVADVLATLVWNGAPPTPDDLGYDARVHFFRGGPGEIPIGSNVDSGVTIVGGTVG